MKFCRIVVFILTFLAISGMDSSTKKHVARPFHGVAEAMYKAMPKTELSLKSSLYEFVNKFNENTSEYEAPELCWLLLGEWLTQSIPPAEHLKPWEQEVVDIFHNIINYKKYL